MLVYVQNKHGKPLMPCSPRKARLLLKEGKAVVLKYKPFTIKLKYGSSGYKQKVSLGVDAGSKTIGISATTKDKVLFEANVKNRFDVVDNMSSRRNARRSRRYRKRYRKPRFLNRSSSKRKGRLAPSIKQKVETHISIVKIVNKIIPIYNTIIETASFDIQKIQNPEISGVGYQNGVQKDFWNVRQYVLFRDNYKCRYCKGETEDPILQVHHIESRKTGGNAPNNLITLCKTCHRNYHRGKIEFPSELKRGQSFKDATFMGIMRNTCMQRLQELFPNVSKTYGYITKSCRIEHGLPKDHYIDARCISGNPSAISDGTVFSMRKARKHCRKMFKDKPIKGGIRKRNQCPYEVNGFRRYDLVKFENRLCYISSLRIRGCFLIKDLKDTSFSKSVSHKKLQLVQKRTSFLIA